MRCIVGCCCCRCQTCRQVDLLKTGAVNQAAHVTTGQQIQFIYSQSEVAGCFYIENLLPEHLSLSGLRLMTWTNSNSFFTVNKILRKQCINMCSLYFHPLHWFPVCDPNLGPVYPPDPRPFSRWLEFEVWVPQLLFLLTLHGFGFSLSVICPRAGLPVLPRVKWRWRLAARLIIIVRKPAADRGFICQSPLQRARYSVTGISLGPEFKRPGDRPTAGSEPTAKEQRITFRIGKKRGFEDVGGFQFGHNAVFIF